MKQDSSRSLRPFAGTALGLALVALLAALGALDLAWGRGREERSPRDARAYRLLEKAYRAGEADRWAEAERFLRRAREVDPDDPRAPVGHAAALARLRRTEEALRALGEAAALGWSQPHVLKLDTVFDPVRSDPGFLDSLARVEASYAAARNRVEAADAPLPASAAPSFESLHALNASFEREEKRHGRERNGDWASGQVARRSQRMKRIAALERYVAEHPEAKDADEAALAGLRAWAERAAFSDGLPWSTGAATELEAAAAALLSARPAHPAAREARFHALAARTCGGGRGQSGESMLGLPTAEACASVLPELTAMATDREAQDWAARASALRALCLHAVSPHEVEAFREALTRWRTAAGPDGTGLDEQLPFDRTIPRHLTAAALRTLGPPDFSLTSHEGKTVTLADLRGRVVLLNFWSPG